MKKTLSIVFIASCLVVGWWLFAADKQAEKIYQTDTVKPLWIVDGDTFTAQEQSQNYRLWGIDAPELDQRWGKAARAALIELIHKKKVTVEIHGESYSRPVVRVIAGGKDVGLELLKMGLAWYVPEFAPDEESYLEAHEAAKADKRGLWSDPKPVNPKEFREKRNSEKKKKPGVDRAVDD